MKLRRLFIDDADVTTSTVFLMHVLISLCRNTYMHGATKLYIAIKVENHGFVDRCWHKYTDKQRGYIA